MKFDYVKLTNKAAEKQTEQMNKQVQQRKNIMRLLGGKSTEGFMIVDGRYLGVDYGKD